MSHVNKARIKLMIKLAVAAGLIYFLLHTGLLKLDSLKTLLTIPSIAMGLLLVGCNIWLLNWRWYYLLQSRQFDVSLSQTLSLYLIGIFFNHALPSSVGGDVVKAFYLAREQKERRVDAVLSVLIDRLLGLYSLMIMSLLGVAWDFSFVMSHSEIKWMAMLCGLLALAMTVVLAVGFSAHLNQLFRITATLRKFAKLKKLLEVFEAMQLYGRKRSVIVVSIAASILAQLVSVAFFVYVGYSLGATLSLPAYLFCVPLGFVATALPIAPAGVGVGQVAFLFLFKTYDPSSADLGSASITAFQLAMLGWGMIGSIAYLRYKAPEGAISLQEVR